MGNDISPACGTPRKQTLKEVVNNTASRVVLECTRTHSFRIGLSCFTEYRKGERHSRNTLRANIAYWKIAAKKYQPGYKRPTYVKNKKPCSI